MHTKKKIFILICLQKVVTNTKNHGYNIKIQKMKDNRTEFHGNGKKKKNIKNHVNAQCKIYR